MSERELRHELKYVVADVDALRVETWLTMSPAGFFRPHPPRRVNNVYFDGHGHESVEDNLAGISARTKVRYRWYGARALPGPGALEVKGREGGLGWKLRYELPGWDAEQPWPAATRALLEALPPVARPWLAQRPWPVLVGRYRRDYFLSGDGLLRATLDTRLEAFDQRLRPTFDLTRRAALAPSAILELKCAPAQRRLAARVVRDVPARRSRSSKYVAGILRSL